VGRLPEQHLNLYELALIASERTSRETRVRLSNEQRKEVEGHLRVCEGCRELLEQEQFLYRMSIKHPMRDDSVAAPGCPSEQQWMDFAAGLRSPGDTQKQLEHAMNCAHCSARLRRAAEQFADDTTDEEMHVLDGLASADPAWQRNLARRMQESSPQANPPQSATKAWDRRALLLRLSIATVTAALLLSALWWFSYARPTQAANRLLALAYSERRTTDLRMAWGEAAMTGEHREWYAHFDPVLRLARHFAESGGTKGVERLKKLDREVQARMQEAVKFAIDSPMPAPESALEHVYA